MTLAIPKELHEKMRGFSEIRWSEVARRAIEQRINDLEIMNQISSKSRLTKKDISSLAKKIKRSAAIKFNEYNN